MKTFILFSLLFGIFGVVPRSLAAELVGLQNISLEPDERVQGFEIHLTEGRIISVCLPMGWKITAESYGETGLYKDGGGEIQGSAGIGHDALSAANLSELSGLLLIERSVVHKKPAVLTGLVLITGPKGDRKLQLRPQNFSRRETK